MKRRDFLSSIVCLGAGSVGELARADAQEVVVVVHPAAPVRALSGAELEPIFLTTRSEWGDGSHIIPFNLPPKTQPRVDFDEAALHMGAEEVARFWIDRRVRGGNRPPRQVPTPQLMVSVVAHLPGAIGYVPRNTVDGSVRIVAALRNGKVLPP
jgi:hypothetical protein